jgi:putative sugar O-methyltransferase
MSTNSTSVSDYSSYTDICKNAYYNDNIFDNFKKIEDYTKILEHTSIEYGYKYLDILFKRYKENELLDILKRVSKNDLFGNSTKHNYKVYNQQFSISPSTIYYTKIWSDLILYFGSLDKMNIVEIGGGYGGQCLVGSLFTGFNSYAIYDLEQVNLLQKKYLSINNINNVSYYSTPNISTNIDNIVKYDLLVSNYAFSELSREIQNEYLNKVLLNCKNGYMIMNYGWGLPNLYTVQELKKELKNLVMEEETPKTGPQNCLLYWKE